MNELRTTVANGRVYRTKDRPPSGAPKVRLQMKTVPTDSNDQKWYTLNNFLLIWLDDQNSLTQFQTILGDIKTYTQLHQCFDFLSTVNDTKMALITGHNFARQIVPLVHDIPHLCAIYILSPEVSKHERWIQRWDKVKGVHTDMVTIRQSLEQVVKQYHQDSIAMTFLPVTETNSIENLEQLDRSFLYAQIFQQILLGIEDKEEFIQDFILFWRYHYLDNLSMLDLIDEFARDYHPNSSIWWYTRHDFVYEMLNFAILRSETNIIFYLNRFIKNLNREIEQLYRQQIDDYQEKSLIVYRGQCLSISNFEKLKKAKDGLVCFHNFLLTSKDTHVALISAENALMQNDTIGVLFKITINPSVSSIPFASIDQVSYNRTENEVLFSMNSTFRIVNITEIEKDSLLYVVELQLIPDNDDQFRKLVAFIGEETQDYAGWKELYQIREIISSVYDTYTYRDVFNDFIFTADDMKEYRNKLERIDRFQAGSQKTVSYFKKALEICKRTLPTDHLNYSIIYQNIVRVYKNKTGYFKALTFLDKALEIQTNILPSDHPDFAIVYNNIGMACSYLKDYLLALTSYGKSIVIYEKIRSPNHPQLAYSYDSMAGVYFDMNDYLLALSCYERALEMKRRIIPLNQYDLANSYTNIALTYEYMSEYKKAISYHEKALEIQKEYFSSNIYEIACTYFGIAVVYEMIKGYAEAALTYENLIKYATENFPDSHRIFTLLYRKLGYAYLSAGQYATALLCCKKQLRMNENRYPIGHPVLVPDYYAIGRAYLCLEKYSEALEFLEKALNIRKETSHPNDIVLANNYNEISEAYQNLKDCSKALLFKEKAVTILETIPSNYDFLHARWCYETIYLYRQIGDHQKALLYDEKVLKFCEANLSPSDHNLAVQYNNTAITYKNLGMHSKAKLYLEKAIKIAKQEQPIDIPFMVRLYTDITYIYDILGECEKACSIEKKLTEFKQRDGSTSILTFFIDVDDHSIEKVEPISEKNSKQ